MSIRAMYNANKRFMSLSYAAVPLPVVLLLLFGMALLLYNSATLDLWSDEAWSAYVAQQSEIPEAIKVITHDYHPPLYFVVLNVWEDTAGDNVLTLRYLSILFTLMAGAVIYRLAVSLFGVRLALLALGLFFLHDLVQVLGEEVRPYALAQLLTILTLWAYWRFWQQPTKERGAWFVLAGSGLLWTLYWGGFVLLALGIHALITRFKQLMPFVVANSLIGLSFLPWVPVVLEMFQRTTHGLGHTLPPTIEGYEILLFQLFGRPEVFWIALALLGVIVKRRRGLKLKPAGMLLALVIVLTLGISVGINLFYQALSYRSLSILIPLIVILIASGMFNFRRGDVVIVAGIALLMSFAYTAAQPPARIDSFDRLARFVTQHSVQGEDVVVSGMQWESMQLAYHMNKRSRTPEYILSEFDRRYIDFTESFRTHFSDQMMDYSGVWLVTLDNFDFSYDITTLLNENGFELTGRLMLEDDFMPIHLVRYDRLPESEPLTTFGDSMQLDQVAVDKRVNSISLKLWWLAVTKPEIHYTVSAFLVDADGQLVAQHDSHPLNGYTPTVSWQAGQHYYDSHFLRTGALPAGHYELRLQVYTRTAGKGIEPVLPAGCGSAACKSIMLDTIEVE